MDVKNMDWIYQHRSTTSLDKQTIEDSGLDILQKNVEDG